MEKGFTHSSVAADAHAGAGEALVVAETAQLGAPLVVLHLEERHHGQLVHLAESDARDVESTHEVDPLAAVSLLEDSASVGAELAVGIFDVGFAGLAEPWLGGAGRNGAGNAHGLAHAIAALVHGDLAAVAFHNLVGVVAAIAQAGTADEGGEELGCGVGMGFGVFQKLLRQTYLDG